MNRLGSNRSWVTNSPEETEDLGAELARELLPEGVLLLHGELAAGKTVLTKGVARGLGVPPGDVQSPSYTLIHEHQGPQGDLIHVDLYRLDADEAVGLGLEELLARPGVKVIEWPERLPFPVEGACELVLEIVQGSRRRIREIRHREPDDTPTTMDQEGGRGI